MCMYVSDEARKKIKQRMRGKETLRLWKVVRLRKMVGMERSALTGIYHTYYEFRVGVNVAEGYALRNFAEGREEVNGGAFHCWAKKEDAERDAAEMKRARDGFYQFRVIPITVQVSDVVDAGYWRDTPKLQVAVRKLSISKAAYKRALWGANEQAQTSASQVQRLPR